MINDVLGELTPVEYYEFYDVPRCFLTKNADGRHFLHYWCDSGEDYEGYMITELSEDTLAKLRNKEVDHRSVFADDLLQSREYFEPQLGGQIVTLPCTRLEAEIQDMLPPSGYYVEYIGDYKDWSLNGRYRIG